ncbi:MAG: HAMP domain-containing histidine kinase [Deltaproteobacteria bacterium]|nr:HAMP domain-containing histidine kinase [Deltaproteobacteria bacterium]
MSQALPLPVRWSSGSSRVQNAVKPSRHALRSIDPASEDLRAENLRLETENQALREQVKRALGFAHRVAHDLKGPARKIAAFSRLVQSAMPKNHAGSARAQLGLERNVEVLRKTIDEYLQASVNRPKAADVSVDDLLEQVLKPLRAQYGNVDVTVASFGKLRTHPTALRRILFNVLDNAFKFNDRSCDKPHRVHIDGQKRNGLFVLTVDDNGCGQGRSVHHPARGHGIGLDSLQSDLLDLGATLTLRDWPSGTRSEIQLPLP